MHVSYAWFLCFVYFRLFKIFDFLVGLVISSILRNTLIKSVLYHYSVARSLLFNFPFCEVYEASTAFHFAPFFSLKHRGNNL